MVNSLNAEAVEGLGDGGLKPPPGSYIFVEVLRDPPGMPVFLDAAGFVPGDFRGMSVERGNLTGLSASRGSMTREQSSYK